MNLNLPPKVTDRAFARLAEINEARKNKIKEAAKEAAVDKAPAAAKNTKTRAAKGKGKDTDEISL